MRNAKQRNDVKISKFAKFESYMLESGKDTDPQSSEILQTFVWYIFASFQHVTLKLGNITHFNMLFSLVLVDFRQVFCIES